MWSGLGARVASGAVVDSERKARERASRDTEQDVMGPNDKLWQPTVTERPLSHNEAHLFGGRSYC